MSAERDHSLNDPRETAERPSWTPGAILGGYRIRRFIGAGGSGTVYEAEDANGRQVALKALGIDSDTREVGTDLFSREASLKCRLDHPNIVKVLDAGIAEGIAYLVMEFIAGGSLARHTHRPNLLAPAEVLRTCSCVALALAHAHARGIVHRDVKPDNILLDRRSGLVKLADFGVASLGETFRTQTGVIPGTPAYMSPEQLCGGMIDARTDLYALGAVLFEALSGTRPHCAPTLGALLREVASRDAPALKSVCPDIPDAVSSLVASLLARTPAHRPGGAAAVAETLSGLTACIHEPRLGPKSRG